MIISADFRREAENTLDASHLQTVSVKTDNYDIILGEIILDIAVAHYIVSAFVVAFAMRHKYRPDCCLIAAHLVPELLQGVKTKTGHHSTVIIIYSSL